MREYDYNNIEWSRYFEVDKSSPSGLRRLTSGCGTNNFAGAVAGHNRRIKGTPSYWTVKFKRKHYMVHRVIWIMLNGYLAPELVVDHLDGNPCNNNTDNLKVKTSRENIQNSKMSTRNTSGVVGVHKRVTKFGTIYFIATCLRDNNKMYQKMFPVNKYGYDAAFAMACECRKSMIIDLNKQGQSYTERHGVNED